MEPSLTVLLPVHNGQAMLAAAVSEALELACEMSGRFELLIVDDASSDATSEIAQDLCRAYPQVRLIRAQSRRGLEAAISAGLAHSRGEVVLVRDPQRQSGYGRWLRAISRPPAGREIAASKPRPHIARPSATPTRHAASTPGRPNYLVPARVADARET